MTDSTPTAVTILDPAHLGLPPRVSAARAIGVLDAVIATGAHVLGAVTELTSIPPGYEVVIRVCYVNTNPDKGHVYERRGDLALLRPALRQMADLAAVSDVPSESRRLDDGRDPDFAEYLMTGTRIGLDGTRITRSGIAAQDLRIGSEVRDALEDKIANGTRDEQRKARAELTTRRTYITRLAQAKASNAMIRDILALRQTYAPHELDRPFVALVPQWVGTGSLVERTIAQLAHMGAAASLYPGVLQAAAQIEAQRADLERDPLAEQAPEPAPLPALPDYEPAPAVRQAFAGLGITGDAFDTMAGAWRSIEDARDALREERVKRAQREGGEA